MMLQELERFNPWWKGGAVRKDLLKDYRRKSYFDVEKCIGRRQATLIWGLRRVGKTTILLQIIDRLLGSVQPKKIFYFSLDEMAFELKDILESYQKLILGRTFEEETGQVYIFLDEIQKAADWENKIKVYYDLYPRIKFFLSGSASVSLRKKSRESLAGRVMDFQVTPLPFDEYLELNGFDLKKIRENPDLWKRELMPRFHHYMSFGTFPELAGEAEEGFARSYILNNVIERIVYKDLPEEFGLKDVELLKSLLYIVGTQPGRIVNYREISKNLGKDQRTIANYFEYLEFGLLVKFVFNYRGSPVASRRKMKKAYLSTPNIAAVYNEDMQKILPFAIENAVMNKTNARFFYRNGFEVDFLVEAEGGLTAIEVKKTDRDARQLAKFRLKFGEKSRKQILVSLEEEGNAGDIQIVPIWKFLLEPGNF